MGSKSKKRARKRTERCAGCRRQFTPTGYWQHLDKTTKPDCIAHFEGDYFGNYEPQDFDDFDEYDGDAGGEEAMEVDVGEEMGGGPGEGEGEGDGIADTGIDEDGDEDEREYDIAEDADIFEQEGAWEPPPHAHPPFNVDADPDHNPDPDPDDNDDDDPHLAPASRRQAQERLLRKTFVVHFPGPHAGAPISRSSTSSSYAEYQTNIDARGRNPYAPFQSAMDWKVARWAKLRGPGSTAVSELLQIEELVTLLGLSFKNTRELDKILDEQIPEGRPRFMRREIVVAGESFEVFYRDVIKCIRSLYGDPEFAGILVFTPERHYADADHTVRVYFDMHTGRWWWDTQKEIEKVKPGATIIPIVISSDKTQLTSFGNKTAYPVYMTIGNLPKDIRRKPSRRGQILLAYLPTSRLEHITSKTVRRRVVANLFHACMSMILKPLVKAGIDGIQITSGDGVERRGHPIFAMYIGDYPEQLLVTCCKNGTCPKCNIPRNEVGDSTDPHRPLRNLDGVLAALDKVDASASAFSRACREAGIKPVRHPFWEDLPYVNIFRSITPDILHQLHQGVIKHVITWLTKAYGAEELDARCRRFPPNHQIRLFMKGITTLQRVTGKEHADMCRFLLGLVVGLPLRDGFSPVRLVRAVRAILDFLYLAQYPAHTSETLGQISAALEHFHANKYIFVDLGIRDSFHLPKLHSLDHYLISIKLFGTTDNYDTQYTERLHIDFAKEAYRATNRKDEFPQMTLWLERREKVLRHEAFIQWRLDYQSPEASADPSRPSAPSSPAVIPLPLQLPPSVASPTLTQIKIAKWPTVPSLRLAAAETDYGAPFFRDALARFLVKHRDPTLVETRDIEREANKMVFRFASVPAYHRLKFVLEDAQQLGIMDVTRDAAHARPARKDRRGKVVPARFDTVLVNEGTGGPMGVSGYRVGRLRLIFKLPQSACEAHLTGMVSPGHLAYVEWFTAFTHPDRNHKMYKVSRCRNNQHDILADIIEVCHIRRSCHLLPVCGSIVPRDRTSSTALDTCEDFWVNPFSDAHMYMTLI
ncbi:hypothetical protein LXA43DRAFT_975694 [Ganoderma leucocontextum]|nr:hypothetical protein LXA43DRAFT_975694 [Ganoderma leucocontextum]